MIHRFILYLITFASYSYATGSFGIDVPVNSWIYDDLALLQSYGLIQNVTMAHRPFSRDEIVEWLDKISPDSLQDSTILKATYDRVRDEFAKDTALYKNKKWIFAPINTISTGISSTNSPIHSYPEFNHDYILARFNPVYSFTENKFNDDGVNLLAETSHFASLPGRFNFYFEPLILLNLDRSTSANLRIHRSYASFQWKKLRLKVGKDLQVFGQSPSGGLMFSSNSEPYYLATLDTPDEFYIPLIRYLIGGSKFTLFYINLGPESYFPYSSYAGYRYMIHPHRNFEFGASFVNRLGGEGAPEFSVKEGIQDFFGYIPYLGRTDVPISDRVIGFNLRLTIPSLNYFQFYGENFMEDANKPSSIADFFENNIFFNNSFIFGIFQPRFTASGNVGYRVELKYTGPRYSGHGIFLDGNTFNRMIMGDPLGPDGWGLYHTIYFRKYEPLTINGQLSYESRGNNVYSNDGDDIITTSYGFSEERYRLIAEVILHNKNSKTGWRARTGYERAINFNYEDKNNKNHLLLEIVYELKF